jgi:DNA-binding CsgD family transcriptional regulator
VVKTKADRENITDADIKVSPEREERRLKPEGTRAHRLPKTSLSPRETEICKLLAKGMKVKEVALQLNISIRVAWSHTRNAYLKLGVHDRGELVKHFAEPNVMAVRDTLTDSMSPIRAVENGRRHPG